MSTPASGRARFAEGPVLRAPRDRARPGLFFYLFIFVLFASSFHQINGDVRSDVVIGQKLPDNKQYPPTARPSGPPHSDDRGHAPCRGSALTARAASASCVSWEGVGRGSARRAEARAVVVPEGRAASQHEPDEGVVSALMSLSL